MAQKKISLNSIFDDFRVFGMETYILTTFFTDKANNREGHLTSVIRHYVCWRYGNIRVSVGVNIAVIKTLFFSLTVFWILK